MTFCMRLLLDILGVVVRVNDKYTVVDVSHF